MANIIDYIYWRGDIKIDVDRLNDIDKLILSRISYLDFDDIFKSYNEVITIEEAYSRFKNFDIEKRHILIEGDIDLFPAIAKSERFKNFKLTRYVNNISSEKKEQFSAITIILPNDLLYISYRGTDGTIVAWREDFDMSFEEEVPCQKRGVEYIEEIASNFTYQNLILGGHSKGGNIAIYAATYCSDLTRNRIIEIHNDDGPRNDSKNL